MKLCRFGECGAEKPAVLLSSSERIDVSSAFNDFDEDFFGAVAEALAG